MSKPLELTVNRPFQDRQGNDWYVWGDTCVRPWIADSYSEMKRLTDVELAADYWGLRATLDGGLITSHDLTVPWRNDCTAIRDSMTAAGQRIREQVDALLRFAALPHYDEDQP